MIDYSEIEQAISNREFFLEYLPMIELDGGRCIGAEALCRWRRPEGVVLPDDFVPVIENTPLSGLLTYYVMEEVARDFLAWLHDHDAFISVNIPPELVGRGGLYYVAEKTGLIDVKHKLVAEIIERGVLDRIGIEALNRAVGEGVRVALDDVGTGGTNAIVLSRCNVEMIKIDRHLVSRVRPDAPLPDELEAIVPLLAERRLQVVAEGVETAEQLDALKRIGVRLAQGFHFSQPLSAHDFKAYFVRSNTPPAT